MNQLTQPIQNEISELHREMNQQIHEYNYKSNEAANKIWGDFGDLHECSNMTKTVCRGKKIEVAYRFTDILQINSFY